MSRKFTANESAYLGQFKVGYTANLFLFYFEGDKDARF